MALTDPTSDRTVTIDLEFLRTQAWEALSTFVAPFAGVITAILSATAPQSEAGVGARQVGRGRRAQEILDSAQRFRVAVEAARCGIWEWDLVGDRVFMSEVTASLFGWRTGLVTGQQVVDRVAPGHRDDLREALSTAAVYGDFDVSFRVPPLSGARPVWIDFRGRAFGEAPDGGFARIIGVALDVTEERLAQARAQSAESRLRDAIESTSEAFVLWDRNSRLVLCNKNFRSFFQIDPELLKAGVDREQVERATRKAVVQQHSGSRGQREAELADGRWVQISERPTAEGGLVVTAADITVLKAQEEARRIKEEELRRAVLNLEQSQEQLSELARKYEAEKYKAESANTAKTEFLASMSHELRPSLNAINSRTEVMVSERYGPIGDQRYGDTAVAILASGQHLLALVNDMLDMSNIESGGRKLRFEEIDIIAVLKEAVDVVKARLSETDQGSNAEIEIVATKLPRIEADYRAIKYVLLTLVSNAARVTKPGRRTVVSAEIGKHISGAVLRISVTASVTRSEPPDVGERSIYLLSEELEHREQEASFGLGLSRTLVEMHGGVLELAESSSSSLIATFTVPVRHLDGEAQARARRVARGG